MNLGRIPAKTALLDPEREALIDIPNDRRMTFGALGAVTVAWLMPAGGDRYVQVAMLLCGVLGELTLPRKGPSHGGHPIPHLARQKFSGEHLAGVDVTTPALCLI